MATTINIYAGNIDFDSRLFFPALFGVFPDLTTITSDDGVHYTGTYAYKLKGVQYQVSFEGTGFGPNTEQDFHGVATSGTVEKLVDGTFQTVGTMLFFPDPDGYDGGVLNTASGLTPNALYVMNSYSHGASLGFIGGFGADKLFGSIFDDHFAGGPGNDKMTGYAGSDQFLFGAVGRANADHIADFEIGKDEILLDRSSHPAMFKGVTAANLHATFHDITAHAEQSDDRIVYNHKTGDLSYDVDGSGRHAAVIFAHMDNHATLNFRDFDVV